MTRKIKTTYLRKAVIYFLTFCLVSNVWLPAVLALESGDLLTPNVLPPGVLDATWGPDTTISTQHGTIIDWSNFNTAAGQSVTFNQFMGGELSSISAVLNRISSGAVPTEFNGALNGNGRVFVVNPAGVLFGPTASVNVTQLIASSLDIDNGDFLAGNYLFAGDGIGEVANYGVINAEQGAALIGKRVLNAGTIATGNGGFVVMAAGDRVLLGEPSSKIIVEMDSVTVTEGQEGIGDVVNDGQITAPGGTVALAAGDIFSTALDVRVESGTGRVIQNGVIDADGIDGDGGNVSFGAADMVVLASGSQTTVSAGANGNGGQVVVYSPGVALFDNGAVVEATGGSESGNGGFFELSGKEYVGVLGDIDLSATNGDSGMFLIDPLNLTIVDSEPAPEDGGFTGPNGEWQPSGTGSELDIDILEGYLELANVTLSTVGTVGPEDGDIIFDADRYLHTDIGVDNSIYVKAERNITFTAGDGITFEGNGHVELYAGPEGSVTSVDRGKNPPNISTIKGDIIIEAGRGGIDLGVLQAGNPSTSGVDRPGEIRLKTINAEPGTIAADGEYDITLQHLGVSGKGYGSVYVSSAGNLTINGNENLGGAVQVKTVTTADGEDALSFVCLGAEKNITINGDVLADSQGDGTSVASVWIGAGTHNEDPVEGYYGTITVNGNIQADASAAGTIKADATIRIYGSTINLNGSKAPEALGQGSIQVQSAVTAYEDSPDAVYEKKDPEDPNPIDPLFDTLVSGSRALVEIDTDKDATCLDCANLVRVFLPVAVDDTWIDSKNLAVTVEVLFNDKQDAAAAEGTLVDGTILLESLTSTNGGTLTLVNGDTAVEYTPPSDWTENFVDQDGTYGTYTDTFYYYAVDSDGDVSENPAVVLITLTNQYPVAQADEYTGDHNVTLDVTGDPLANLITGVVPLENGDYDLDNQIEGRLFDDVLSAELQSDGAYGTVILNPDGTFTYTPTAGNTTGTDSFTYYVTDGYGGQSDPVTVNISLTNQAPVAQDDAYSSEHNVVLDVTGDPLAGLITGVVPLENGDYDPDNQTEARVFDDVLTAELQSDATYGTVVLNPDGTFTYTPTAGNTTGTDSFTYNVNDGYGGQSGTVTVSLSLTNENPVANPDLYSVDPGNTVMVPAEDGTLEGFYPDTADFDPDNSNPNRLFDDTITAVLDDGGATTMGGSITLNSDGSFTYEPPSIAWSGTDSFSYYVTDGYGGISSSVQVIVQVQALPVNSAAPGLVPVEIETSGCPALVKWAAGEIGIDEQELDYQISNSVALGSGIQPCDSCGRLKNAAVVLQDTGGVRIAALATLVGELTSSNVPLTEEEMASVAQAISSNIEGDPQHVLAREYLDALAEYVSILSNELGLSTSQATQVALDNYIDRVAGAGDAGVIAFVTARLNALAGI